MALFGCQTIRVPNVEACGRKQVGAVCTYTVSGGRKPISEADWLGIRLGRISFAPKDWADIRRFIEETCAKNKDCRVEEVKEELDAFESEIQLGDHGGN